MSAKDVERVAEATGKEVEAWQKIHQSTNLESSRNRDNCSSIPLLYTYDARVKMDGTVGNRGQKREKQPDGSAKTRESS